MTRKEIIKRLKLTKTGKIAYFKDGTTHITRTVYVDDINGLYVFYKHYLHTIRVLSLTNTNKYLCKLGLVYSCYK